MKRQIVPTAVTLSRALVLFTLIAAAYAAMIQILKSRHACASDACTPDDAAMSIALMRVKAMLLHPVIVTSVLKLLQCFRSSHVASHNMTNKLTILICVKAKAIDLLPS